MDMISLKHRILAAVDNLLLRASMSNASKDRVPIIGAQQPPNKSNFLAPVVIIANSERCLLHFDCEPEFVLYSYSFDNTPVSTQLASRSLRHYCFESEGMGDSLNKIAALLMPSHEYVAIVPADILISVSQMNSCFHIARSHDLDLFQPALSVCSYCTWDYLIARPRSIVRQVPTIEQPLCFSNRAWNLLIPTFSLSKSFYGLDTFVWPALANRYNLITAVIDAIVCRHTKPVESGEGILKSGITARQEQDKVKSDLNSFLDGL